MTGSGRGKLADDAIILNVPSEDTARIQESHILISHIICGLMEEAIFGSKRLQRFKITIWSKDERFY